MASQSNNDKKNLDFDLNLVPFIDMFSVVLCFLIMTAVQVSVGSIDLKQSTGSISLTDDKTPILVLSLNENSVGFQLKNGATNFKSQIAGLNKDQVAQVINQVKAQQSNLGSAIVLSGPDTEYQKIVTLLEVLKSNGLSQVGISSL